MTKKGGGQRRLISTATAAAATWAAMLGLACQTADRAEKTLATVASAWTGPYSEENLLAGVDNRGCDFEQEAPLECDSGDQTWTCHGICVSLLEDGENCEGGQCDDVCGGSNGNRNSSSCVKEGSVWVCRDSNAGDPTSGGLAWLYPCDPGSETDRRCPSNMYCEYITDSGLRSAYQSDYGTEYWCNFTGQQDSLCGGSITRPCHAGYACVDGRCKRQCQGDNDCPCDLKGNQDFECYGGRCAHCAHDVGDDCGVGTVYGTTCCESELRCGSVGKCCIDASESCNTDDECCVFDDESCINGTCAECNDEEEFCDSEQDCCFGLTCVDDVCIKACNAGDPCNTGLPGVCAVGVTACNSGQAGPETCEVVTAASAETCDGLDNDCDGSVDEGITFNPSTCTQNTVPGCQTGFSADGEKKCINGTEICEVLGGVDFCNGCPQTISEGFCGGCVSFGSCVDDDDCAPNHVCNQTTQSCEYVSGCGPNYGICWMPENNGECNFP